MNINKKIKGFSIIELLVALIIIGILTAIIIPTLSNRSETAREKAALSDLTFLKDAEERAEIDTGYMYRLYVLDDVKNNLGANADSINKESTSAGGRSRCYIDPKTGNLYFLNYGSSLDTKIINSWQGPYISWQKDVDNDDIPDDPWGNDYILVTPFGRIDDSGNTIVVESQYDRYTVVSKGPDGIYGFNSDTGINDDLTIQW